MYLGTTVTNQNLVQEEIEIKLNSGNACYHLVQSHPSIRLLSKNLNIKICETVILPVVLYGCESWSVTMTEERKLRALRRIFGPKRNEVT
jgi:hypothetical protein